MASSHRSRATTKTSGAGAELEDGNLMFELPLTVYSLPSHAASSRPSILLLICWWRGFGSGVITILPLINSSRNPGYPSNECSYCATVMGFVGIARSEEHTSE